MVEGVGVHSINRPFAKISSVQILVNFEIFELSLNVS